MQNYVLTVQAPRNNWMLWLKLYLDLGLLILG